MAKTSDIRTGVKAGLPLVLPSFAIGLSFGVLAQPIMGSVAPILMSLTVVSGAAQFAALSVLTAGGGTVAAIAAGMLMNARWIPMGLAVGPFLKGRPFRRSLESLGIVDASFALSSNGDGTYDRGVLIGSSIPQASGWILGTAAGVLGGSLLGDPQTLGLDAMFPAFYAALLFEEARTRPAIAAAALGALIAFLMLPWAPPGLPVVVAAAAALIGLRRQNATHAQASNRVAAETS